MSADQLTLPLDEDIDLEPDGFHDWMLWLRQQNLQPDDEENDE
jgi:hypothetical protein